MSQLQQPIHHSVVYSIYQRIKKLVVHLATALFVCLTLCIPLHLYADSNDRIIKWKDDKGVTHYGDKIPPQYSNRENSLINKQGITVQQNKPSVHHDEATEQAKLEQDKKDKALLGTFTNADEIDLTRDRNLEPDLIALKSLQQDRVASQKKLDKTNALAASFSKVKKSVPADINNDIQANKAELAKIDQRIIERQQAIEAIRKRFEEDKKRYLTLRGQNK
jgi:hypothetical protein